ncbi:hypothetical protein HLB30_02110 [Peptostreptococcus russellii]|uniref:Uncharacterized protein n=1 Tax=Peptostreptococcus russellii TaxID=215200 RepID=A0A1H8F844_9FIRM|nr:hypothetical protein [Peptostreptococcus russellii]MBC2577308.1 hypothetical protein [Peptostreptococcus russellii]SEN27564.1 hypothetical protein SAMN05216454_10219 [Peptostreptococcus russellii]
MIKKMRELAPMELYFRLISLMFWPIYWYKWIVITIENYNNILFYIYFVVDAIFITLLIIKYIRKKIESKRYFKFALSMSLTYLITLSSFMIFTTNITLLYAQIIMCIILMVESWKLIKEDYNDIGVVGVLAALLILILTYFY